MKRNKILFMFTWFTFFSWSKEMKNYEEINWSFVNVGWPGVDRLVLVRGGWYTDLEWSRGCLLGLWSGVFSMILILLILSVPAAMCHCQVQQVSSLTGACSGGFCLPDVREECWQCAVLNVWWYSLSFLRLEHPLWSGVVCSNWIWMMDIVREKQSKLHSSSSMKRELCFCVTFILQNKQLKE